MEERTRTKARIAVLLSDMGILKKLGPGRADELTDAFAKAPDVFREAVERRTAGKKGSALWRQLMEYALEGTIPSVRLRHEEPVPQARVRVDKHGEVRASAEMVAELIGAGRDLVADMPDLVDGDGTSAAFDMAEGLLVAGGLARDDRHFNTIRDWAAEYVAKGMGLAREGGGGDDE